MDFEDCIKFANETPVCYLATADGDQPRVRALGFWFAILILDSKPKKTSD
ncbi:MAG: hypothetical protein K8E24_005000 [Methanobacterium paludis]|nr:hypothetical protein [Methanobacterium paludis]